MDQVSFKANQFYSTSLRLFANTFATQQQQQQQLDSKLVAFCTILTVALSVLLLSFKQSRSLLLNATVTTSYHLATSPFYLLNVRKCFRCLKQLRAIKLSSSKADSSTLATSYTNYYYNSATNKYLKLKRLHNFAAASLAVTKFTCSNYLLKPLNTTFTTMRKQTNKLRVKNVISLKSILINGKSVNNAAGVATAAAAAASCSSRRAPHLHSNNSANNYCATCDSAATLAEKIATSQSYPVFNVKKLGQNSASESAIHRSQTSPRINSSRVVLYKKLPLRSMSRAWGEINSINLPVWCRKPCFYFYSWMFSCNLDEIDIQDLNEYKNLSEFFRRALKPDARTIDQACSMVSPCDGKILHFGKVDRGYLEQVKGVNYSLRAFLGEQNWPKNVSSRDDNNNQSEIRLQELNENDELYEKSILYNPENCLYHCVIYLAPGDYHRFHSPADWQIFYRRHFPGELFSVNPSVARWLQGLFNFNERVVYYGEWEHGFFSMTAVGATNVGSIRVYMDDGLETNTKLKNLNTDDMDRNFCQKNFSTNDQANLKGVPIARGENFGEFNLGSTIVLIFEAPKDFEFKVKQSEKVLFGCQLGSTK